MVELVNTHREYPFAICATSTFLINPEDFILPVLFLSSLSPSSPCLLVPFFFTINSTGPTSANYTTHTLFVKVKLRILFFYITDPTNLSGQYNTPRRLGI
ncbi:hypothetical protein D3C80_106400 [compost metagenome]